jgi:hypothetical protein
MHPAHADGGTTAVQPQDSTVAAPYSYSAHSGIAAANQSATRARSAANPTAPQRPAQNAGGTVLLRDASAGAVPLQGTHTTAPLPAQVSEQPTARPARPAEDAQPVQARQPAQQGTQVHVAPEAPPVTQIHPVSATHQAAASAAPSSQAVPAEIATSATPTQPVTDEATPGTPPPAATAPGTHQQADTAPGTAHHATAAPGTHQKAKHAPAAQSAHAQAPVAQAARVSAATVPGVPDAPAAPEHEGQQAGYDGEPQRAAVPRRRRAKRRLPTQRIFSDLAAQAAIPASAYAVGEDVDGAMCLMRTAEGFEVFNSAAGARHEVRVFQDEESAYFYLFGVLVADAVRTGALAPRPA